MNIFLDILSNFQYLVNRNEQKHSKFSLTIIILKNFHNFIAFTLSRNV